jgi:hypothetical protein
MLARRYGIGSDLGLVRLYLDTYPDHDNRLREMEWGHPALTEDEDDPEELPEAIPA